MYSVGRMLNPMVPVITTIPLSVLASCEWLVREMNFAT